MSKDFLNPEIESTTIQFTLFVNKERLLDFEHLKIPGQKDEINLPTWVTRRDFLDGMVKYEELFEHIKDLSSFTVQEEGEIRHIKLLVNGKVIIEFGVSNANLYSYNGADLINNGTGWNYLIYLKELADVFSKDVSVG